RLATRAAGNRRDRRGYLAFDQPGDHAEPEAVMRTLAFLSIVASLLASAAGAQTSCVPGDRPIDPYYEKDTAAEWPREAQRFKAHEQLVSREHDRLWLALDGGKSIELVDCPYGEDGYHYLFERYDQAGRFYVVRRSAQDDFSYTLVMM